MPTLYGRVQLSLPHNPLGPRVFIGIFPKCLAFALLLCQMRLDFGGNLIQARVALEAANNL